MNDLVSSPRSPAPKWKLGALALLLLGSLLPARASNDKRAPALPAGCEALQAPAGSRVSFHAFALGVQIYRWNDTTHVWDFVEPAALLFADEGYHGLIGVHYAGPTWASNSGSLVVGSRVTGCTPDPSAIPWLRLRGTSTQGPGPLAETTTIQRVNTTGGLAPTRTGSPNEVVGVPYSAEYFFYRMSE